MRVGLFVTCLVDAMRPSIGFSTLELLELAGCEVHIPQAQTCCGQPAWNSGDQSTTHKLAMKWLKEFETFDYVVIPSGSCAGMISAHYPQVFINDPDLRSKAVQLAEKTFELTDFLINVIGLENLKVKLSNKLGGGTSPEDLSTILSVTYHDSCSGLRELGVKQQPRQLINVLTKAKVIEMQESEQCCGFGGTFSIKYGEVSSAICDDKCKHITDTGAQAVVLGDLGCMLNIKGRMSRLGNPTQVIHISELLTGRGEPSKAGV